MDKTKLAKTENVLTTPIKEVCPLATKKFDIIPEAKTIIWIDTKNKITSLPSKYMDPNNNEMIGFKNINISMVIRIMKKTKNLIWTDFKEFPVKLSFDKKFMVTGWIAAGITPKMAAKLDPILKYP